jgi:hypothetical protein
MRRIVFVFSLLLVLILLGTSLAYAGSAWKAASDPAIGAQLYDKWYAVLGISAPQGGIYRSGAVSQSTPALERILGVALNVTGKITNA